MASSCVLVWGTGMKGELGSRKLDKENSIPLPTIVPGIEGPCRVSCGDCASAVVTVHGRVWVTGSGRGGRLGLGDEEDRSEFTMVEALKSVRVVEISVGESHMACLSDDGRCFTWGKGTQGELGIGSKVSKCVQPTQVDTATAPALIAVSCGFQATMALSQDGKVFSWGSGEHGKLGHGSTQSHDRPKQIQQLPLSKSICMGSLYAGAVDRDGGMWMWGYGGHGNLGLGTRSSHSLPQRVQNLPPMRSVACTVGQINPTIRTKASKNEGTEGPHTLAVSMSGEVWTWGTCHKGILGNMKHKTLIAPGDQLEPYRIGDVFTDAPQEGHSHYLEGEVAVQVVSSSIHSAVLTETGSVYSFGCASGGRMGVRKFLTGLTGSRSRMKCYISAPTQLERFLEMDLAVSQVATSRRHMLAVAHKKGPSSA